jgi:hypothetical protein
MAALLEDVQKTANHIEATIRKFNEIGTEENEFVKRRRIDETTIAELNKKVSELEDRDSVQLNELYLAALSGVPGVPGVPLLVSGEARFISARTVLFPHSCMHSRLNEKMQFR